MLSLQDFPVGSYFYWIRRLNPKEEVVVYSRFKITEHDTDGNLLSDAAPENHMLGGSSLEVIEFKAKHPDGFTIVHSKDKYLNYNPHNMIVPEILFDIHHFPEKLPNTPFAELQKIFGSGLGDIDELIKAAKIYFEEWNIDKGHKTVVKLKDLKNVNPGQSIVVVSPPPYSKNK